MNSRECGFKIRYEFNANVKRRGGYWIDSMINKLQKDNVAFFQW